jgi:KamA family protein
MRAPSDFCKTEEEKMSSCPARNHVLPAEARLNSDPPAAICTAMPQSPTELPVLVDPFYESQITNSEHRDQLRGIVQISGAEYRSGGDLDTSGEHTSTVITGLQHKYRQTALLLVTEKCFSYCRFCFRRRFVGTDGSEIARDYGRIADYIATRSEITNVLITGGDPLVLGSDELREIVEYLLPIRHLNSIRFGTKAVVYAPQRFEDDDLFSLFQSIRAAGKTPTLITHVDHLGEISSEAETQFQRLWTSGVQLLNQAVLLRGINDDPDVLATTMQKLHGLGVHPYYLFQARPVSGARHFQVELRRGAEITRRISQRLSGIEKTFRYVMSHRIGKVEILGLGPDGRLYMRFHQSPNVAEVGRIFSRPYREGACWLDDLPAE